MIIFFVVHLFLTRWLVQKEKKKKKTQKKCWTETKIKPCIVKSKTKNKRVAQLAKAQMREKINKNAFLQCLWPTLLSQEKAPNQSQLDNTSSFPSISTVSHCRMTNPGSIFSQWAHGFTLQSNLLILCVSVPWWVLTLVLML